MTDKYKDRHPEKVWRTIYLWQWKENKIWPKNTLKIISDIYWKDVYIRNLYITKKFINKWNDYYINTEQKSNILFYDTMILIEKEVWWHADISNDLWIFWSTQQVQFNTGVIGFSQSASRRHTSTCHLNQLTQNTSSYYRLLFRSRPELGLALLSNQTCLFNQYMNCCYKPTMITCDKIKPRS